MNFRENRLNVSKKQLILDANMEPYLWQSIILTEEKTRLIID